MKKRKLYLGIGAVVALIIITCAGYFYAQGKKRVDSGTSTATTNNTETNTSQTKGEYNPPASEPIQTKPSETTTATPESLGTLADVSLTAYLYSQSSVAPDGTTQMPAGSFTPFFYPDSGTYTIQKMVGGAWKDVITAQSYPGHGGLAAWFCGPAEDNVSYRVLKIQNGQPVSASKTFVVKKADFKDGTVTYN